MGPRFFKRGEQRGVPAQWQTRSGFNGATLLQAWRVRGHGIRSISMPGLQWGHASSSVESRQRSSPRAIPLELQWGHASSSVESAMTVDERVALIAASMGPRFFKRGELFLLPPT